MFKNILIPADFTINTEVAVAKALELLNNEEANIYLLHVVKASPFLLRDSSPTNCEKKMDEWKKTIEEHFPFIKAHCLIKKSNSVQKAIIQTTNELKIDLVVIGQSSVRNWLPQFNKVSPMHLAEQTAVPVLTAKPGALHNKPRTVVVPIAEHMPGIKLSALEALCAKSRLNIHLITLANDKSGTLEFSASMLLHVYQLLKAKLRCSVDYSIVHGTNKARAILQYAEKHSADILLVHPEKETRIGWHRHIPDALSPASKIQILAV